MLRDPQIARKVANTIRNGYVSEELEWKLSHFGNSFVPLIFPSFLSSLPCPFFLFYTRTHTCASHDTHLPACKQKRTGTSRRQWRPEDKHLQLITRAFLPKTSCENFVACFILKTVNQVAPDLLIAWETKWQRQLLICLVVNVYEQHDAFVDRRYFIWASHQPFAGASLLGAGLWVPEMGKRRKGRSHTSVSQLLLFCPAPWCLLGLSRVSLIPYWFVSQVKPFKR